MNNTCNICRTKIKLRTIIGKEWRMTSPLLFCQNIYLSRKFSMWRNRTRLCQHLTALNFFTFCTTKQSTNIISSFTPIKEFTEHFNTSNRCFRCWTQSNNFNFITNINTTKLNTPRDNSTTTRNRKHIFNRHKEWLINWPLWLWNISINSLH